jgi:hypothetical protein
MSKLYVVRDKSARPMDIAVCSKKRGWVLDKHGVWGNDQHDDYINMSYALWKRLFGVVLKKGSGPTCVDTSRYKIIK